MMLASQVHGPHDKYSTAAVLLKQKLISVLPEPFVEST